MQNQNYPFLFGIVRYGKATAWLVGAIAGGLALWLGAALVGWPFACAFALVVAAGGYAFVRLMAELVRVITEMLLPQ